MTFRQSSSFSAACKAHSLKDGTLFRWTEVQLPLLKQRGRRAISNSANPKPNAL
jgi:hypothetical protein